MTSLKAKWFWCYSCQARVHELDVVHTQSLNKISDMHGMNVRFYPGRPETRCPTCDTDVFRQERKWEGY